jgi:hypothetical protein
MKHQVLGITLLKLYVVLDFLRMPLVYWNLLSLFLTTNQFCCIVSKFIQGLRKVKKTKEQIWSLNWKGFEYLHGCFYRLSRRIAGCSDLCFFFFGFSFYGCIPKLWKFVALKKQVCYDDDDDDDVFVCGCVFRFNFLNKWSNYRKIVTNIMMSLQWFIFRD